MIDFDPTTHPGRPWGIGDPGGAPVREAAAATALLPRAVGSLALWLAADRITGLSDGSAVTTWPDLSGSGRDATQSPGTAAPTYKTNILNGRPVVRFDGGDWLTAGTGWNYDAYTIFAVVRFANVIDDNLDRSGVFALASGVNDRLFLMSGGFAASDRLYGALNQAVAGEVTTYATDITAGTPLVLCLQCRPTGTQLFVNGVAQSLSNNDAAPPLTAAAELRLGARYGTSFTDLLVGDIAEFLLYRAGLATYARRQVTQWLGAKWGVMV